MTIKAIIFDYGEVLNAQADPEGEMVRRASLAARLGLDAGQLWSYLFGGEPARRWMTGRISEQEFWTEVLRPRGFSDPDQAEAFGREVLANNHMTNVEMVEIVHQLKGRYKLAVLSNASWSDEELEARLDEVHGVPRGTFDAVITSSVVGHVKPDEEIYRAALTRLEVRPEEAVFVDDLAPFADAATALGVHGHAFTTPARFRAFLAEKGVTLED